MGQYRVPNQNCPDCKTLLTAAAIFPDDGETAPPKAGDFTVCIVCTALLIYEVGMKVRLASKEELRKLPPDVLFQLVRTQTAIREMHRQRRRANYKNN